MSLQKHIFIMCASASALLISGQLSAVPTTVKECAQEMLMSYYPEQFVVQTLEKFKVPQAQRAAIISELAEKDKQVIPMVEERAGKMSPNPLRDPKHRQEAVKIFRDSLYELFAQTMQAHGVNDREQIQSMLDDIQQQKAKAFASCMNRIQGSGEGDPAQKLNSVRKNHIKEVPSNESEE